MLRLPSPRQSNQFQLLSVHVSVSVLLCGRHWAFIKNELLFIQCVLLPCCHTCLLVCSEKISTQPDSPWLKELIHHFTNLTWWRILMSKLLHTDKMNHQTSSILPNHDALSVALYCWDDNAVCVLQLPKSCTYWIFLNNSILVLFCCEGINILCH